MPLPPQDPARKARILQRGLVEGVWREEDLGWAPGTDLFAQDLAAWDAAWVRVCAEGLLPEDLILRLAEQEVHPTQGLDSGPIARSYPPSARQRYEPLAFLGDGGMGSVFKARDLNLGRVVAIKFLKHLDAEGRARFLQESRVQALVNHPHVLPIFEAGDFDGEPYLAMHLVEGLSLKEAQGKLTLAEKVAVIRDAAEALHACHRQGILHRDIKPANILLEAREGGRWHAYVMDFGLARGTDHLGHTRTGLFMGTPVYLSPEQAKGESLDRRSDVYALGTTLYELLCGSPPFSHPDTWELLRLIALVDPEPIQNRLPDLPRDLALIVGKVLDKDPVRRYDSARALAEDLSRFLDGDPVLAQPPTLTYRLFKLVRKNRSLAWVTGISLVLVTGLGAYGVRATLRTRGIARLSEHFGGEAERMEAILYRAYTLPLHDTRSEREEVRTRMARLRQEIKDAGAWAEGPGHLALGRGHLALGRLEEARADLEVALRWGPDEPRVVQALGQTLALLYRSGMEGLRAKARLERAKDLEASLRQPALALLRQSKAADPEGAPYAEAFIALLEERPDEALQAARRAQLRMPWFHGAWVLEGDLHRDQANVLMAQGQFEAARVEFAAAGEVYKKATAIARSAPAPYLAEAHRRLQILNLHFDQGTVGKQDRAWALEAVSQARMTDPDGWQTFALASGIHRQWALHLLSQGEDPLPSLDAAITEARAGLSLNPDQGQLLHNLGTALRSRADVELGRGGDPRPFLRAAIETLQRALAQPRYKDFILDNLGNCHAILAQYAMLHGEDPTGQAAIAARCLEESQSLKPWVGHVTSLGWVRILQAQYARWTGGDPLPFLQKAKVAFGEALALNANSYRVYLALADASLEEAAFALVQERAAALALGETRAHLRKVDGLRPGLPDTRLLEARLELLSARSGDALAAGRGLALLSTHRERLDPVEATLLEAQLVLARGKAGSPPGAAEALARLQKTQGLRPDEGRLWFLRARLERALGRKDASEASFREAFARNATLRHLEAGRPREL